MGLDGISNSSREEGSQGETLSPGHGFKIGVRLDSIMHVWAQILCGNPKEKRTTAFLSRSEAHSGADADAVFAGKSKGPFEIEEDAC
jgi:hypothetical protein